MAKGFFSTGGIGYDSDVNNKVAPGNVYPSAGATTGSRGSAMTPFATGAYSQSVNTGNVKGGTRRGTMGSDTQVAAGATDGGGNGFIGQPLTWWVALVVLLIVLHFVAKRVGQGAEFSNIRPTVWNVLLISLAAAVGLGFLKVVFSRVQVPGLSTYIQAI